MNTALVKPSKTIKGATSIVRTHLDAVERARGIYLAQIKRAEAEYFERINRAMDIVPSDDDVPSKSPHQVDPERAEKERVEAESSREEKVAAAH